MAKRQLFVTSPGAGRFPAGELTRRDPQLFATSAMTGSAEAHSRIAPLYELFGGRFLYHRGSLLGAGPKPLEANLAALSGIPAPYGPADGATGSYL
jgi:hypothetical protein